MQLGLEQMYGRCLEKSSSVAARHRGNGGKVWAAMGEDELRQVRLRVDFHPTLQCEGK